MALGELALDLLERPAELGERGMRNADAAVVDRDHQRMAAPCGRGR